ncbi:hypothetical protein GCM10022197_16940 [Microlunatus spumicola]|uniref:Glyoxalase-like domain-containing protein n=1 Tax=Microlunatus spumicola TaxID=81499 RepID=A0ABP6X6A0_9ACTN
MPDPVAVTPPAVVTSSMDLVTFTHVVLDGSLSDRAAAFWGRALNGSWRAAAPDPGLAASLVQVNGDSYVHRAPRTGTAPALVLEVADVPETVRRLLDLGAGRDEAAGTGLGDPSTEGPSAEDVPGSGGAPGSADGDGAWEGMRSPGGLPFALTLAHPHRRAPAARWKDGNHSRLVQVCLDCPPDRAQAEAEFWRDATGWAWQDSDSAEFVCHLVPSAGSLQLLVQRRASPEPPDVTLHLDLGTSDREAEADRLVALGAERVATGDGWIVLRDPDGTTFCATGQPPEAP